MMVVWLTMYMVQNPPKYDDVICEQPLSQAQILIIVSAPGPDLPGKEPGHDRTWLGPDKIKDKDFPN